MKKIIGRTIKITIITVLAGILTICFIILFPQHLFANRLKCKVFTVYSNEEIDTSIQVILNKSLSLVTKSELYDSTFKYNIILSNNSFYNKIDDNILGPGRAAQTTLNNIIIKVKIDPKRNLAFPTFHKACEANLTEIIAHEMIHCLQTNKYEIVKFSPFHHPPLWKLEGYPEYISKQVEISDSRYNLIKDINRFISLDKSNTIWISSEEGGCEVPKYYYEGKLLMEYLINIRRLSYNEILKSNLLENDVYQDMIKWRDSTSIAQSELYKAKK